MNVAAYSVGYQLRTSGVTAWDNSLPYAVVVGHNCNWASGDVYPDGSGIPYAGEEENIFVGGTFTGSSDLALRVTGGPCDSCLDNDFDNAQSYYSTLSDAFAAVPDNVVAVIQYTQMTITCSDSEAFSYSVTVDGDDFSTVTYYTVVGCNRFAQIVINIGGTGSTVEFQGDDIPHDAEKVLYNVLGANRIVLIETEVTGNILAPNNQFNQPGDGVVVGVVIVANVQQALQINRVHCVNPAPVPHPPNGTNLCPAWESDCLGLDFPLDEGVYSFRDFNVISFDSFTAATGDIEGRLAARNDVSLGAGFSIGYQLETFNNQPDNSLPYSLVAGRDCTWISGALFPDGSGTPYPGEEEGMFCGHSFTGSADLTTRVSGNCTTSNGVYVAGCLDQYFDAAYECYEGYSNALAGQADNVVQTVVWDGLFLTCDDSSADVYYVTLTPDVMATYTYTSVSNCNFQAFWIINVAGSGDVFITGDSFPAICGGVVYNIIGARTVNITDTSVCGHVLAPDATIYQPGGVIVGKVVAGDVSFSLQINKNNNCPNPGTVTLPTSSSSDAPSGQTYLQVQGSGGIMPNDVITINSVFTNLVVSIDGNTITLNNALTQDIPAGSLITATVSNANGRPIAKSDNASSSHNAASSVAAVASFVLALLALAF